MARGTTDRAVCPRCKQNVRIYVPAAGDGSVFVFSLHRMNGAVCIESKAMVEEEDGRPRRP